MNSNTRSLLVGASLLGLLAFFAFALTTQGLTSDTTVVAFSLLTMHGLTSIAAVSYSPFVASSGRMRIARGTVHAEPAPRSVSSRGNWTRSSRTRREPSEMAA